MNLLVVSWEYSPYVVGGMGKHVSQLVPSLAAIQTEHGFSEPLHTTIVTPRYSGGAAVETLPGNVTVHRVDCPPVDATNLHNSVAENNRVLTDYACALPQRFDLIHVHDWLTAVAGINLKYEWKVPLVVTIHATERGRHQGWLNNDGSRQINTLEWRACFEAWRVIVCSDYMAQEVHDFFGTPLDKISVIPNGIDPDTLHLCDEVAQQEIRAEFSPFDEHLLFFVGRIVHEKGLQVLIRAMPQVLQKHRGVRLLVAGKNCEQMWPLASELGIAHSVNFLGFISDERRDCLYQAVDTAVFPSLYEPFGIVALEAMALGCNVVASDVGGLGEVVRHQQTGLTVFPNDPASIAWAVDEILANPRAAARRRERAQYQVEKLYDWRLIAQLTANLYREVVSERRRIEW